MNIDEGIIKKIPDNRSAFLDNHCLLLDHMTPFLAENSSEDRIATSDVSLLKPSVAAMTDSDSVKLPTVSVSFKWVFWSQIEK